MILSSKMKAAAAVGGAAAAALVCTATPAFAFGNPTGNEAITTPVSVPAGTLVGTQAWTPPVDANANPIDGVAADNDTITGTGYDNTGATVFGMVCDGNPPTAVGWSVAADCDSLTATAGIVIGTGAGLPAGEVQLNNNPVTDPVGVFRGIGPNDQFNCLAPADSPQASTVNLQGATGVTPAAIDPTVPSWGSPLPLNPGIGGGSAPCTIRIGYSSVNLSTTADKFFPLALPQVQPQAVVPESPLTIALPIGGVVLFGAAGAVLYRKRRHAAA